MSNIQIASKLDGVVNEANPWGIENVPYERQYVEFVDSLLQIARKNESKSRVQHQKDWETIHFIYRGFCALFPKTAADFEKHMKNMRSMARNDKGIAREGEAMIQHQLEVPQPFYQMVNTIFPDQKWDKQFVFQLSKYLPVLKPNEKI